MGGPRGPAPPAPPWREFPYGSQGVSGERGHAHAEPADRMFEVLDQLGWIESVLGIGRRRGRRGYLLGLRRSSMASYIPPPPPPPPSSQVQSNESTCTR